MKSFKQFLSESINISGDFNGNLYINGSDANLSQENESFTADVVWEGKIYRLEIGGQMIDKTKLAEQLQGEYPGAIVHNIYPQTTSSIKVKNAQRYQPERLSWSE